jgi:hypothetical protein
MYDTRGLIAVEHRSCASRLVAVGWPLRRAALNLEARTEAPHAVGIPGTPGTPDPLNHAVFAQPCGWVWAVKDSNLRPWD